MSSSATMSLNSKEIASMFGRYGTLLMLAMMILIFSLILPPFRTTVNIINILGQTSVLAIFAAGMTCCLKMGDFDLSIGAVSAITGIIVAKLLVNGVNIPTAIIVGIATGAFVGMLNGILVAYVGLSAFVCTLATMSVILGIAMVVTEGISIWGGIPDAFQIIGRENLAGIPIRFLIAISIFLFIWFLHVKTAIGRKMEAIGGNAEAAKYAGISVEWYRMLGFILSGTCSAIAGIVLTSSLMSAGTTQGTPYLLDTFGACFIGATTMKIGQFHIWGTFIGVIIVVVAINGMIILQVPGYYTDIIKGMILLLAIAFSGVMGRFLNR